MNKWQAQQEFWSSFGLSAYDQNTVPDSAQMPYITYEAVTASFEDTLTITASLWYRSRSWSEISVKASEIERKIYNMPPSVEIEGGRYKVRLPSDMPFAQRMEDPEDKDVRRIVLNVEWEFLTAY